MSASTPANNPGEAAYPVKNKALLTVAVMGASIIQILDSTIANVAIPHMQSSLGATLDTITWVLTSYIIASAIAMPITGWLADRVGSRNLFLAAVAGFIVTSMLCGIAVNLEEMVFFRVLQGVCAAFIGPLSQTIMLDINPPERAPRAMAIWGMGIMVAPIFGPMIGGFLTENYNWRWVFYINLPIGIPTLLILWWLLPSRPIVRRRLDGFGFAMLALGLAALQLMLDRGQHEDWFQSGEILIEFGIAIAALWIFLVHMATSKSTLFEREIFANRNFSAAMAFSVIVGLLMFGLFALLPPMLQNIYGYTVIDTGILLAPRGIGILVSMMIASRLIGLVDPRYIMGTGFLITAFSMWMMLDWTIVMSREPFIIAGFIQGIGMGLTFIPMNTVAFATLPLRLRTDGSSLLYLTRSLGGSLGISLTTTMLSRNMQGTHEALTSYITSSTFLIIDPSTADRWGLLGEAAMTMVNAEVTRQAAMIAYLNVFMLMMFVVLSFLPLLLILKPVTVPKGNLPQAIAE